MEAKEYRIGNLIADYEVNEGYFSIEEIKKNEQGNLAVYYRNGSCMSIEPEPIPLTEEWLMCFGFSVIYENSAGKRYGYVSNGVFSDDLSFTFWKTTKEAGKFFRGDLQLKSVHQLQNLFFALTKEQLTIKS